MRSIANEQCYIQAIQINAAHPRHAGFLLSVSFIVLDPAIQAVIGGCDVGKYGYLILRLGHSGPVCIGVKIYKVFGI